MNSINIIGRLTAEIELRRTQTGKAVATYSLAVRRPRTKDTTDFLNVVTWEQGAEYLAKYAHKGDTVAVNGMLTARQWNDNDGRKRTSFEIVSEGVELLSSKKSSDGSSNTTYGHNSQQSQPSYAQQNFQQSQPCYSQQNFQQIDVPDAQLPF